MDPNEALRRFRALLDGEAVDAAVVMVDLDAWLAAGGFLPRAWSKARPSGALYPCDACGKPCHTDGTAVAVPLWHLLAPQASPGEIARGDVSLAWGIPPCAPDRPGGHAVDLRWHHDHAHDADTTDPDCRYCAAKEATA